jgi:DNA repair protein RecN (Recombination protein N)
MTEYTAVYANWKQAATELTELTTQSENRSREADQIRSAVEELSALDPKPGEDLELSEKASKLTHLEELRIAATAAHNNLSSEGFDDSSDALTMIGKARRALEAVSEHDPELAALAEQLKEIGYSLNETSASISGYLASLDTDGASELESIQQRRAEITTAMRKYGPTLEEVIAFLENSGARLLELDSSDTKIQELTTLEQSLGKQATELAKNITALRTKAASALAKAVTTELGALAMTGASLEVSVSTGPELGSHGADQISILLSAYPGAEPRALGKGASGGELSRIMLAIEVVLAKSELAPTFIFDEVDAGVGGKAAIEVGRRLAALAKHTQVIVVTHLPQVAAWADSHFVVKKSSDGTVTASDVQALDAASRVEEIARMLAGLEESTSAREHAAELLAMRG